MAEWKRHLVYTTHFASGEIEAPKGNEASPMSHGKLGTEPGS